MDFVMAFRCKVCYDECITIGISVPEQNFLRFEAAQQNLKYLRRIK